MALHIYSCAPLGLTDTPYGHIYPEKARALDLTLMQAHAFNEDIVANRIALVERAAARRKADELAIDRTGGMRIGGAAKGRVP